MLLVTAQQGENLPILQFSKDVARTQFELGRALEFRCTRPGLEPHYSGVQSMRQPVRSHSDRSIRKMAQVNGQNDDDCPTRQNHFVERSLPASNRFSNEAGNLSRRILPGRYMEQLIDKAAWQICPSSVGPKILEGPIQECLIQERPLLLSPNQNPLRGKPSVFIEIGRSHRRSCRTALRKELASLVQHLPISTLRDRNLTQPTPNLQFHSLRAPGFIKFPGVSKESECVKTVQPGPEWNLSNHFLLHVGNSQIGYFGMIWSVLKVVLKIYFRYTLPIQLM